MTKEEIEEKIRQKELRKRPFSDFQKFAHELTNFQFRNSKGNIINLWQLFGEYTVKQLLNDNIFKVEKFIIPKDK